MPALYSLFAYWLFITDSKKPLNLGGGVGSMKGDRSFHGMHRGNDAGTLTRSRRGHQCLGPRGEASRGDGRLRRLTGRAIVNAAEPGVSRARPLTRQSIDLPTSCKHAERSRSPC